MPEFEVTDEFFVRIGNKDIIRIFKGTRGPWHEELISGDDIQPGKTYMSYLSKKDILNWIQSDFPRDDVRLVRKPRGNPLRPRLTPYTGHKLPRANPGAQWHEHQASLAKLRQLESKHQPDKDFYLGQEIAHIHSQAFSKNLGIPNPLAYGPTGFRPPRAWFYKMMANVARGYRKPSAMTKAEFIRAVARIVGGIWARFDQKTRNAILRKYEGG